MEEENIRQVIYSEEFDAFYQGLDSKIQDTRYKISLIMGCGS